LTLQSVICYNSTILNWRCAIKRKIILSLISFILILVLVIAPIACVTKRTATDNNDNLGSSDTDRIAALESKVSQLQSKIASLPTSSGGNYDADIAALQKDIDNTYAEMENFSDELDNTLAEVDDMLTDWEEEQADNEEQTSNTDTATDDTTRWSLNVWTDYESINLLEVDLDSNRIEDEDDYTIWLLLYNRNHRSLNENGIAVLADGDVSAKADGYLYFNTQDGTLWETQSSEWNQVSFSSIYQPVEIKGIDIEFSPKSTDRVIMDESHTELYSSGYPSFDWDMDFSNRADGTCKKIEAETSVRFTLPIPSTFRNNDPELPYPEQFKLEFELAYKK